MEVPGLLVIVQLESVARNPVPVTVTDVPAGPEVGLNVIDGPGRVTVKAAVAKSPLIPLTVTTYTPGAAGPVTVKLLAVNTPEELIVHVNVPTMLVGALVLVHVPASPGA